MNFHDTPGSVPPDAGDVAYGQTVPIPLPTLLGHNVHRLRTAAGATQQRLADAVVRRGLQWTAQHVSRAERGRWSPDLTHLVVIAAALDQLPGQPQPVTLADLVDAPAGQDSPWVDLSGAVAFPAGDLARILRGEAVGQYVPQYSPVEHVSVRGRRGGYAAVDRRVAAELGLAADEMREARRHTWGHSLSEEREARIAAKTAERGKPLGQTDKATITALLRDQLVTAIEVDEAVRRAEAREEGE